MLSNPIYEKHYIFLEKWTAGMVTGSVASACLLGWIIASEKWLLVAGLFGLLLLAMRPIEVALGLYTFLIPFETITTIEDSAGPTATLLRYVGLLAIFTILGIGWLSGRLTRLPRTAWFWSLFVLWGTASTLWAIDPELALSRIPTAVGLWLLYVAVISLHVSTRELFWMILLTILGGCGASLYSTYVFLHTGEAIGRVSLAEGSTQSDPNFFALSLLLPLSLAIGEVLVIRSWLIRSFYLATTGVISVAIFLTMSRGALAAVGAIIIVFVLRFRLNWRILVPIAIAGSALLFMPPLFFERMQEASASRVGGRQDIWQVGIRSLQTYGIFGAGMDNFSRAFQKFAGTSRFFAGDQRDSHNIYLGATVEYGIVGMLFLIAAVRSHLKGFHWSDRTGLASTRLVAFEAACWGMLIAGLTLDVLWRKAFWLNSGFLLNGDAGSTGRHNHL